MEGSEKLQQIEPVSGNIESNTELTNNEEDCNDEASDHPSREFTASTKSGSRRTGGSKFTSEKGEDDMYPMTTLTFRPKDVKKRYTSVVGPLSLFAPYPHEEVKVVDDGIEMERPVTPIDEEIKTQPLHFTQLAKYIRRRLAAKPDVAFLSIEEQQGLAGILMGEVNGIWPDIRRQIDDPFLTPDDNKELNRRIAVHIVTVCEQLFKHYIDKAQILNKRGIFSGPANMSRLKAQLALDANKFLNVLMIRRYIVSDIRGKTDNESHLESDKEFIYARKAPMPRQQAEGLTYKALVQASRPKSKSKKYRFRTVEEDLDEMSSEMPSLDTKKLASLVQQLPTPRPESVEEVGVSDVAVPSRQSAVSHIPHENIRVILKRSRSLPELTHETLADELDLVLPPKDSRDIIEGIDVYTLGVELPHMTAEKMEMDKRAYIQDDLRKLSERQSDSLTKDVDDDLPPLIQAILTNKKHDGRKAVLDQTLKRLKKKREEQEAAASIPLKGPTYPQPATVPSKLPNKMVVRASDIRVSERVCMSSITLNQSATVYNDLLDDISATRIKQLDSNLFLGSEVKEVYEEIMKTVPTDHMDLEVVPHYSGIPLHKSDETIEPSAKSVNLATAIASSTLLNSKKKNRIVNKHIQRKEEAPWMGEELRDWARTAFPPETDPFSSILKGGADPFLLPNTLDNYKALFRLVRREGSQGTSGSNISPNSPMKDTKGAISFTPMTPNDNNLVSDGKFIPGVGNIEDLPPMVAERMSRSYNSWLQWWKNTINYDDYLKYLSNKETDYLAAVFHFYNSEDEDEEDERSPSVIEQMKLEEEREKQRQKTLDELRCQKAEFTPGMWNVNSVLLGGLGRDPATENEDEVVKTALTPTTDVSQKKKKTIQDLISDKLASRTDTDGLSETGNVVTSRLSQAVGYIRPPQSAKTGATTVTAVDTSTPQDRLERVWSALKMPDSLKLDMAIKYSSDNFISLLDEAIESWQKASDLIVTREALMGNLERFERMASDPNRFFERGFRGSSVARLEEAKSRSILYRKIEAVSIDVKRAVKLVEASYNDVMTYQGRPYLEKMKWDRTEMLYWLSEERRTQALEHEAMLRDVPLKVLQLSPLTTN